MESVMKILKISNVLNPRGFRIPNCDQKGFYKKKQVITFKSSALTSFFADAFYLKSLTLHQLQGLSPMWLSILLKGEIGILFLGHTYLESNMYPLCNQPRFLNYYSTTICVQDDK